MRDVHGRWLAAVIAALCGATHAQGAGKDLSSLSLEDLGAIEVGVASRISQALDRQPASVTTLGREQIRRSGARTLNELLMLTVPGYFLVEDQDDTIAAVRGLAPDNNSKLMLLLDGRSLNAEWFWGPADALLNGLDLEMIERIEVIRGPGSVTLGQGALLGVVNIVTRRPDDAGHDVALIAGDQGRRGASWRWHRRNSSGIRVAGYASLGEHEGAPLPNAGLARQVEQGLSVFERSHHVMRGRYRHLLLDASRERWSARVYRFDQERDLYSWRRDREQVRQVLTGVDLSGNARWADGQLTVDGYLHRDDVFLGTHGGTRIGAVRVVQPDLVMGGHREQRGGMRATWTSDSRWAGHRVALGAELNHVRAGQGNADGNNFIVNAQERVLGLGLAAINAANRWSLPDRTTVYSLFLEDFVTLGAAWEGFYAARWDNHPDWGSKLSPRLGLLWTQSDTSQWRLSLQSGFRGAVGVHYSGGFEGDGLLREANFGAIEANPYFATNGNRNLDRVQPETMTSVELAWQWRPTAHWRINTVLFANTVRDVIGVGSYVLADPMARARAVAEHTRIGTDVIGDWGGVFYFQNNDGRLRHIGLEVDAEYRRDDLGWVVRASHAWLQVDAADPGQFGPGNIYVTGTPTDPHVRSFPENVTRLQAEWRPLALDGRFGLTYTHLHYPTWHAPAIATANGTLTPLLDGDHLGNLAMDWAPAGAPAWGVTLQIKNLWGSDALLPSTTVAGEESLDNIGAPAREGRSAWATLRWRFD